MSDTPLSHQTVTVEQPTPFHTEAGLSHSGPVTEARAEVSSSSQQDCYLRVTQPQTYQSDLSDILTSGEVGLGLLSTHRTEFYVSVSQPQTYTEIGNQ